MATVTLDTLVLQWEALKADFNRKWAPEIRAIQTATEQGETYDQVYSRYQAASDAVLVAFAELAAIRNSADSIFSEFGVPAFIAKTEITNQGLTTFQNNLAISLGRAQRNQATATSTSQAASGGTASTPQTMGAASAVDPANANTAAGGQPSPGIPLGGAGATVTAIPGTASGIAAGASGAIALPSNFGTTAGSQQAFLSREDASPTVAQNIRSSAQSQAQNSLGEGPLPNPLDQYSSYTYNLALYLCTKNQYNSFATAADGPTLTLPGDQLIARSGGGSIGANQRNEFFSDLDLGIDKLQIDAAIGFNQSGQPTSTGDLSFTLVEPAGATFLYRLQSAVAALVNKDPSAGRVFYSAATYAMVIRFYGYDSAGNIVTVKSGYDSNDIGAGSESAGISKIFFFQLNDISTRIGARVVEYHVKGTFTPSQVARGAILGVSPARFELTGTNLNDIFNGIPGTENDTAVTQDENPRAESSQDADAQEGGFYGNKVSAQPSQNIPTRGLAQALNQEYLRLSRPNKQGKKVVEFPDEYRIVFASEELKNAKVVIPGLDNDLSRTAGVRPTDTKA
jgi:hypothetical protein